MYTELSRISKEIETDINHVTQHIFDRISDRKTQHQTSVPIDDAEEMCTELRELCIALFKQEIDEFLYSEGQALRPFLDKEQEIND